MAKAKNATEGNSSITNQTNNSTSDSGIVSSSNSANTINIIQYHYNYGWGGSNDDWYNTWDGLKPNSHHFNKYRRLYFYAPETIMVKKADNNSAPPLISDLKYPKI